MNILFAGDYCPHGRVASLFEDSKYNVVLGDVKELLSKVDYSVLNLECPVTINKEKPIEKFGPNLSCTGKGIEAIKWAGFNCVTLANNHFLDYGSDGVNCTIETCKKYNLDIVGGGRNLSEASEYLVKEINGNRIAIINCCEHEFSIASEVSPGSNPLNPIQQYYNIQKAKNHADYIIIIVHGGHEQFNLPSPRMKEIYHFFIEVGADVVINHHQHCFSGYEVYKGHPIFYGLGNFCFDMEKTNLCGWHLGYMVSLSLNNKEVSFQIIPYIQCKEKPCIEILHQNIFDNELSELNSIISDDIMLKEKTKSYYANCMRNVAFTIDPLQNRYIKALQYRGLLPLSFSKEWIIRLQNYVLCESHRDKLEYFFNNYLFR